MDIEPVQPLGSTPWAKIVRRHNRDEDPHGGHHGAEEDEQPADEPLEEDEEGHQHIDIRV